MSRMSKIHVWVGVTSKNQAEFDDYYEPNTLHEYSQFMKDLGYAEQFDEDFLHLFYQETDDIVLALETIQEDIAEDLIEICHNTGIHNANIVMAYTDASLHVENKEKTYNDMKYIGVFNDIFFIKNKL